MEKDSSEDGCIGAGSVAGAVIGTFLTTILLLAVAALLYRQWRRHKGKHLVLVTDPEIVDDAYAFDNPCFKDATLSQLSCSYEKPAGTSSANTSVKHSPRWPTSWVLGSGQRSDKKRILDDSCLGPRATKVNVVSLRSHDFTGLGFNVCGNMREGIFVKDLLHRGPASESGRIHPGDRIASVKISFRNMVYEDALTILSYASPYDVELEVESGITGSKPTTLMKKSVGPNPTHICHPLYRSQSIPELPQAHRTVAKRLFIAEPNEVSTGSKYSPVNSTLKSSKSTPGSHSHTPEGQHGEAKSNHHKFGIKVLPALDGALHRIENQNEHNTNLERRHSKKLEVEKKHLASLSTNESQEEQKVHTERGNSQQVETIQFRSLRSVNGTIGINPMDSFEKEGSIVIPSEVPTEVHNAAMAAQRNRRNSAELLDAQRTVSVVATDIEGPRSPQKNKRKAPAPPKINTRDEIAIARINNIADSNDRSIENMVETANQDATDRVDVCAPSPTSSDNGNSKSCTGAQAKKPRTENLNEQRRSESDTDSELQNSFTTIELNPADITIHRTPVPEVTDDADKEDDIYRKAASLGDLSKYECKASTTLERAQSLDMTDTGSKKRKAPLPPEDINESTEDLTKLDQIDAFDRRKLKKSNEWGTLEDVLWSTDPSAELPTNLRVRRKSNGTLERSKSAVEIKLKEDVQESRKEKGNPSEEETSIELYNLPLSKKLTQEFLRSERNFDPSEDNSLARIVNDGRVVKSPTFEEVELDFRRTTPLPEEPKDLEDYDYLKYTENYATEAPHSLDDSKLETKGGSSCRVSASNQTTSYVDKEPIVEATVTKVNVERGCRGCGERHSRGNCERTHSAPRRGSFESPQSMDRSLTPVQLRAYPTKSDTSGFKRYGTTADDEDESSVPEREKVSRGTGSSAKLKSSYQHVVSSSVRRPNQNEDNDDEDAYEFGSSVTVNSKSLTDREQRHNANNVSVSSEENSEDSGLVGESTSMDYNPQDYENRPPLPTTPMPQKMTYITEIEVPSSRDSKRSNEDENSEPEIPYITGNRDRPTTLQTKMTSNGKPLTGKKPPVPPRRSDISKLAKEENSGKQILYVSEYKSLASAETESNSPSQEDRALDIGTVKFEHWTSLHGRDQSQHVKSSASPQTVTNIVLSSGEEKVTDE